MVSKLEYALCIQYLSVAVLMRWTWVEHLLILSIAICTYVLYHVTI